MLHSVKELQGFAMAASDGDIGKIEDVYFDDAQWTIRHLVVDTGGWLGGRRVLISPPSVLRMDWAQRRIQMGLTQLQVKSSPDVDTAKPVSRQHEIELCDHFGHSYYWAGPFLWGYTVLPGVVNSAAPQGLDRQPAAEAEKRQEEGDPHLRSCKEVVGYDIRATDDTIGHVDDFLFDEEDWSIRLMVVDTRNWWPGKHVLVAPQRVIRVNWEDGSVEVDAAREDIENSPEYDSLNPPAGQSQHDLYQNFGRPPQ